MISFLIALSFSGCLKQRMIYKSDLSEELPERADIDLWRHFFFWGLVPDTQEYQPVAYCEANGQKLVATETRLSFLNGILTIMTYGLYIPQRLKIWCE